MTRIITDLLNLFYVQTTLMEILFLAPKPGAKFLLTGSKKCSDCYIFSIKYKLIYLSLPLNPAIHRIGNTPTILCPRCKESEKSHPHFIFHWKLSQNTLNLINRLINQNYKFQSPFKICINDILIGSFGSFKRLMKT